MNRTYQSFGILSFVFSGACGGIAGEELELELESEPTFGVSWETYRNQAQSPGPGEDSFYIAEWDLVFPTEAALRAHYEETILAERQKLAVFQQTSTGFEPTYPGTDAYDIVYCVSNSFTNKAVVVADLAAAARGWQDVANVRFRYNAGQDATCNQNNANVDFAVLPTTQFGLFGCGASKLLWPAVGGCPVGGNTVNGVLLMQYGLFPGAPPNNGLTPTGVLRHELGHMIGFRHEHPWAPSQGGCAEAPTIAGLDTSGRRLTAYDQASVMHYASCNGFAGTDQTISQLDGVGARSVYGMPASWYMVL